MSKWTERAKKRAEREQRQWDADQAEAKRRHEDPSSKERMVDAIDEVISDNENNPPEDYRLSAQINKLAKVMRTHISGEEYFE